MRFGTVRWIGHWLALGLGLAGCGSGGTDPGDPAIALGLTATSGSVAQAGSTVVGLTLTRSGGFTGTVSFALEGVPSGVTGSIENIQTTGSTTTGTATIQVGAATPAGVHTLTLRASGSGVTDATASFSLTVTVAASYTLTLDQTSISSAPGANAPAVIVTLTRSNFTGAVTLTLEGAPNGVTGAFAPASATGGTATLTVAVGSGVAAGSYNLTVRGKATGLTDRTAPLSLTVTAAGPVGFTMSLDPGVVELSTTGGSANGFIKLTRNAGFTGTVTFSVTGLNVVIVVGASPGNTTGSLVNLLVIVPAGTAAGSYTATIHAKSPGFAEQTVPLTVKVLAPSQGAIHWDVCSTGGMPLYFAAKDGNGPWTHVIPDGTVYSFSFASGKGAIAFINLGQHTSATNLIEGFTNQVYYLTRDEMTALANTDCTSNPATPRTAHGTVQGINIVNFAMMSMGSVATSAASASGGHSADYTLINLTNGPHDLVAIRMRDAGLSNPPQTGPDRVLIRRALDPAPGGTLALVDMESNESTTPETRSATITGALGETFSLTSTFLTANGTVNYFDFSALPYAPTTRSIYGMPDNLLIDGDLHRYQATTTSQTATRTVTNYSHNAADQTLGFGPVLTPPTVSVQAGGATGLLRVQGVMPADYLAGASVLFSETIDDPRIWGVVVSRGWLGGVSDYDFQIPDLSALVGWVSRWSIRAGSPVNWVMTAGSGVAGVFKPTSGTTYRTGQARGSIVP